MHIAQMHTPIKWMVMYATGCTLYNVHALIGLRAESRDGRLNRAWIETVSLHYALK